MSIGPRLPTQEAENCECGGVLVFSGNYNGRSEWKCGQCDNLKYGPATRGSQDVLTRKDIQEEIDVVIDKDGKEVDPEV